MTDQSTSPVASSTRADQGDGVFTAVTSYLVRGLLFILPALVTITLIAFIYGFITDLLSPITAAVLAVTGLPEVVITGGMLLVGLAITAVIGAALESFPYVERAAGYAQRRIEQVPGVGSLYGGFREMSETVANGEESFEEVKLVEYPTEGAYTMAFVTADTPEAIEASTGHESPGMVSLFLPMGPNPVMGGFVIYVSRERVHDVDISVEEGLQAVITSGVALNPDAPTRVRDEPPGT